MTLLSICIPSYEAGGRGVEFLEHNFKQLKTQLFKDFEIIVSDDSSDEVIADYIKKYTEDNKDLNIKYIKNKGNKNIGSNTNNAIKNANGEIIQIMCQDDYFYNKYSLQKIVDNFDRNIGWMVSMYMHTKDRLGLFKQQIPSWSDNIYLNNTIGAPSCLSFLNDDNKVWVDENLKCFVDCEHYYRLYKKWGLPKVLKDLVVIQYLWEGQATSTITQDLINAEVAYINNKVTEMNKKPVVALIVAPIAPIEVKE
jgi:glycosyltransferase involved in cell wall biosynthesis